MIIILPATPTQNGSVLPRYYEDIDINSLTVETTNEDTRESADFTVGNFSKSDGFLNFQISSTGVVNPKENNTFKIKISDSVTDLVYFRGLAFVTDQNPQNYSING